MTFDRSIKPITDYFTLKAGVEVSIVEAPSIVDPLDQKLTVLIHSTPPTVSGSMIFGTVDLFDFINSFVDEYLMTTEKVKIALSKQRT